MKLREFIDRLQLSPRGELIATAAIIGVCVASPTIGMLVYMNRSLDGERHTLIAERAAGRRAYLELARADILHSIDSKLNALRSDSNLPTLKPGPAFGHLMLRRVADGCLVLDKNGVVVFPIPTLPIPDARRSKTDNAAEEIISNTNLGAVKLGRTPRPEDWLSAADQIAAEKLGDARSRSGRVFLPSILFTALSGMPREHPRFATTFSALRSSVHDFTSQLPTQQRTFLWRKLARYGDAGLMPFADAEEFSAAAALHWEQGGAPDQLLPMQGRPDILQVIVRSSRYVLLFKPERLAGKLGKRSNSDIAKLGFSVEFGRVSDSEPLARLPVGKRLPGWELRAVGVENLSDIDAILRKRRIYTLLGSLAAAALATLLAAVIIRRVVLGARTTQMRQDFLSTVSHELRTPLTSIRMFVDTLASGPIEDTENTRSYLEIIRRENERLSRLVENFLAFSRLESGRMEFQFEPISPLEIADAAQAALAQRFEQPGCVFTCDAEPNLPVIHADQAALASALVNLLENALKYTPEKKRITLKIAPDGEGVVFSVSDNGPGIAAAELKRLGERFHRVSNGRGVPSGFGLGLSIVRAIVDGHGGTVTADSGEGGSTFHIHIPPAKNTDAS